MVFWQFVVLAILMGGLLLCAGVLTRTLVYTNYRLKKLEEALLVRDRPIRHAEARATEMQQRVVAGKDGASYLTIRDLKSRGKRPSAHPRRSSSRSSPRIPESLGPL